MSVGERRQSPGGGRQRRGRLGACLGLTVVLVAPGGLTTCTSTPGRRSWPGSAQAARLQASLRSCLARHGVRYRVFVAEPGTARPVVPVPAPPEWWATEVGYGLLQDPSVDVAVDVERRDPNEHLVATSAGRRAIDRLLFGPAGEPGTFAPSGCFSTSLRQAGFYDEDRSGTGFSMVGLDEAALLRDPAVTPALRRHRDCLRRAGVGGSGPDLRRTLERRFERQGLLPRGSSSPGGADRGPTSGERDAASDLERRTAVADVRCHQRSGLDRALDGAIRAAVVRQREHDR